jgi:hypothetical protein
MPTELGKVLKPGSETHSTKPQAFHRIGAVLEYQECHYDKESPAANEQRIAGARDVAATADVGAGKEMESDRTWRRQP